MQVHLYTGEDQALALFQDGVYVVVRPNGECEMKTKLCSPTEVDIDLLCEHLQRLKTFVD